MELDFALLAAAADTHEDGRVSLVGGGFDGIAFAKLPGTTPISLVARFSASQGEIEESHTIKFELVTPSGEIKKLTGDEPIKFALAESGRRSSATGIGRIIYRFEEQGRYQIHIYGDGKVAKTLDLHVIESESQQV
jgi:hypothetical protein